MARHQHRQVIAALIRTIFAQPDHAPASGQLRQVVDQLSSLAPDVADRLQAMESDLLAYTAFPPGHWSKMWSNNPIERLNRELKRRTDVVQIFPNTESVIRLVGPRRDQRRDDRRRAPLHRRRLRRRPPRRRQPTTVPAAAPRN